LTHTVYIPYIWWPSSANLSPKQLTPHHTDTTTTFSELVIRPKISFAITGGADS